MQVRAVLSPRPSQGRMASVTMPDSVDFSQGLLCRVSNELGAGNSKVAKHVCNLGLSVVAASTCFLGLFIFVVK